MKPYRELSAFLKEKFGGRTNKLCVDAGFTCPNRDGTCGTGGCIYCGERGSGEFTDPTADIATQVKRQILREEKKGRADRFIVYFQNFTNTYAPVDVLRQRYDAALTDPRIVALAIATRPDCIDENVVRLLASYAEKYCVWVELGLQTASDETAERINRGYRTARFTEAVDLLNRYGIDVVTHLIVGLPGETESDLMETVDFLSRHRIAGIKIHSLYVMEGTALAEAYRRGEYVPVTREAYVSAVALILAHIPEDWVIHRLTGDCDRNRLLAPAWSAEKNRNLTEIDRYLRENNVTQGCKRNGQ